MSIVIVTKDQFTSKRKQSALQEKAIKTESRTSRWQMNDIRKPSIVFRLIVLALVPIMLFWTFLLAGIGFALSLFVICLRLLAKLFPRHLK